MLFYVILSYPTLFYAILRYFTLLFSYPTLFYAILRYFTFFLFLPAAILRYSFPTRRHFTLLHCKISDWVKIKGPRLADQEHVYKSIFLGSCPKAFNFYRLWDSSRLFIPLAHSSNIHNYI